jgi:hypothetical protein
MKTRGRDEATRPAPAMQTTTRTSNTLKFVTEPTDAEVHVAGLPPHAGSPWTTELPTGVYQVEIHRSGYKAWLTSIELAGAETQTLRVVLQPLGISGQIETASLAITTTPPGLDVVLDGKLLNEKTPLRREVDVGPHAVAVRRNGIEMWRQSFKAEPNSDYEFNPSFTAHAARASTPPAVETTPAPPDAREEPKVEATTVAADAGVEMPPPPAPLPVPVPAPPPAPVAAPNQVFVVARAVKRLSGGTPNIDKSKYTELPSVISVKLCIDTHGTVASVDVLTRVDAHTATVLADTLRTWKYAPYKQGATAVSACFSVPFRVK